MMDDELKEIRGRLEAATPGPWDYYGTEWYWPYGEHVIVWHADNIAFVENAPTDIRALLIECERLRKERNHANREADRLLEENMRLRDIESDRAARHRAFIESMPEFSHD